MPGSLRLCSRFPVLSKDDVLHYLLLYKKLSSTLTLCDGMGQAHVQN
jgi:hypothetical protein